MSSKISITYLHEKEYSFRSHCVPGATKIFVAPNGTFYPCEKLDNFNHLSIGNIKDGVDLERVKKSITQFMEYKNKYCKHCFLLHICNLCIQSISNGKEWDEEKFKLFCRYAKNDFKAGLKVYCTILEHDDTALDFFVNTQKRHKEVIRNGR